MIVQEGKYYRTRDGRKVGPMEQARSEDGYAWSGVNLFIFFNRLAILGLTYPNFQYIKRNKKGTYAHICPHTHI